MDPEFESLKRQKSGQTNCPNLKCRKKYNNRTVPNKCEDCQTFMGGNYEPKEKALDAKLITSNIASVRLNTAGVAVRVFVDLKEAKVCSNFDYD